VIVDDSGHGVPRGFGFAGACCPVTIMVQPSHTLLSSSGVGTDVVSDVPGWAPAPSRKFVWSAHQHLRTTWSERRRVFRAFIFPSSLS
jgi:hypothetical protein